jgi:hypothetical protein
VVTLNVICPLRTLGKTWEPLVLVCPGGLFSPRLVHVVAPFAVTVTTVFSLPRPAIFPLQVTVASAVPAWFCVHVGVPTK